MRYLSKSFTLPVSQGVSQAEWDRIFSPEKPIIDFRKTLGPAEFAKTRAEGRRKRTGKSSRSDALTNFDCCGCEGCSFDCGCLCS